MKHIDDDFTLAETMQLFQGLAPYKAAIENNKNRPLIESAIGKLSKDKPEKLSIKEFDKLIGFMSDLIKAQTKANNDPVMLRNLNDIKAAIQGPHSNNLIEDSAFITPEGRMPNAGLMVKFTDSVTNEEYVIMIENQKFKQLTTPAGKVDAKDVVKRNGSIDLEATYKNGAAREFSEEAVAPHYRAEFINMINEADKNGRMFIIDRDTLGIPEFDKNYDTRLLTVDLGRQNKSKIRGMLQAIGNEDSSAVYCLPAKSLAYDKLDSEVKGKFTEHIATVTPVDGGASRKLTLRPTAKIVLNGPEDRPDLGFANAEKSKGQTTAPPKHSM